MSIGEYGSIARLTCLLATINCVIGTLAWYWATTGTTPPWAFGLFGQMRQFRSSFSALDVPIEYFGVFLFSGIFVALRRSGTGSLEPDRARASFIVTFLLSAAASGVAGALALHDRFADWTMNAIAVTAFVILMASTFRFPSGASLVRMTFRVAAGVWRQRRRRWAFVATLWLFISGALWLQAAGTRLSMKEAATQNFLRWFSNQPKSTDPKLQQEGRVRVLAFTDYQNPLSAASLPLAESAVRQMGADARIPIDLEIHDYPMDTSCNREAWMSPHTAACEAAAAVRFVQRDLGHADASLLAAWLYEHSKSMTSDSVQQQLVTLGLRMQFRDARREILHLVSEDATFGSRLGVLNTPAFLVDGIPIPSVAYLEAAIRFELERDRKQ